MAALNPNLPIYNVRTMSEVIDASLGSLLASMLFEITTSDPLTYAGVAVLLFAVMLLASYVPARRAARVDPILSLRQE